MKRRILDIFDIIGTAMKYHGSFNQKLSVMNRLFAYYIGERIAKKNKNVISTSFLDYRINGYSYPTIDYLVREIFIRNEYHFKATTQAPVIIDCGANIGVSVLFFKKLYPDAKIIAFEANEDVFRILQKNMHDNNIRNVELHNIALNDQEGEISFFKGGDPGTLVGSVLESRGGSKEVRVKAQKLSSFLRQMQQVDLVKMDIEGAEIRVLKDLQESGTLGIPKEYIIEYHHNLENSAGTLSDFLKVFESAGYSYNLRTHFTLIRTFQDVLIHFYR